MEREIFRWVMATEIFGGGADPSVRSKSGSSEFSSQIFDVDFLEIVMDRAYTPQNFNPNAPIS